MGIGCRKFVPVLGGNSTKNSYGNELNSGQACRPCRGSFSPIPGRDCSGGIPGDGNVDLPPGSLTDSRGRSKNYIERVYLLRRV